MLVREWPFEPPIRLTAEDRSATAPASRCSPSEDKPGARVTTRADPRSAKRASSLLLATPVGNARDPGSAHRVCASRSYGPAVSARRRQALHGGLRDAVRVELREDRGDRRGVLVALGRLEVGYQAVAPLALAPERRRMVGLVCLRLAIDRRQQPRDRSPRELVEDPLSRRRNCQEP